MINSLLKHTYHLFLVSISIAIITFISPLRAYADTANYYTGCIKVANGTLYNLALGTSPSAACNAGDTQVSADYGDVQSVTAGAGLTGGGTQGDITLSISDSGITTAKIADLAVSTAKIAANAITEAKLAIGAITESIIADLAVTTAKIADLAVTTAKIASGAITTAKLADNAVTFDKLSTDMQSGWLPANESWTYSSSDDPTYTLTISGDKTTKYYAGQRIKLYQTTGGTKYFLITKVAYSDPSTTLTLYGGTDYDLNNESISNPYYSMAKAPSGFPLDPSKWTVELLDTTLRAQESPTQNVWYNLGNLSLTIPIGIWNTEYLVSLSAYKPGASVVTMKSTLSTANNSESDADFTAFSAQYTEETDSPVYRRKTLSLTSKTTYYLNALTTVGSVNSMGFLGGHSKTIIRAISAYL